MEPNPTSGADTCSPSVLGQGRRFKLLVTLDAVGGVWRYAMELAASLSDKGVGFTFAGFGPGPSRLQAREAEELGELNWFDTPLDWMADSEAELSPVYAQIARVAASSGVDLIHVNLPSQAAYLDVSVPVVVASHSCVPSWFARMGKGALPEHLRWQKRCHRAGFDRAAAVIVPSRSHGADIIRAYGPVENLYVVHNAASAIVHPVVRQDFVFAAARWWDEAKNGKTLDEAAVRCRWPIVMAGDSLGPGGQELTVRHAVLKGPLSHSETMELMRHAAIFASPSIYEPFGLAALEAAQSGAALVLADIPTYREIWDGAALFAEPRESADFARALNTLIDDRALRDRYAGLARQRGASFLPVRQADAMFSIYENVLAIKKWRTN